MFQGVPRGTKRIPVTEQSFKGGLQQEVPDEASFSGSEIEGDFPSCATGCDEVYFSMGEYKESMLE
jgi:hypothetical protein